MNKMASGDGPAASPESQLQAPPPRQQPGSAAGEGEQALLPAHSPSAWLSGFLSRSHPTSPRSRPDSPRASVSSPSSSFRHTRFSPSPPLGSGAVWRRLVSALRLLSSHSGSAATGPLMRQRQWPGRKKAGGGGRRGGPRRRTRGIAAWIGVVAFFFLMNWWMFSRLQEPSARRKESPVFSNTSKSTSLPLPPAILAQQNNYGGGERIHKLMYTRLLALAAHALAETTDQILKCLERHKEEHFISYLRPDIRIVKELPVELRSLDLEAIGSLVTDEEVMKESKPSFYMKKVLPVLLKNRVVHFIGFGNRLAFDPIPFELQRLRCRCNFHALQFVSKIQETGALLVRRMRHHALLWGPLEHNLLGPFAADSKLNKRNNHTKVSRYLAVHLRFEIDMASYSMCYFGGGKDEEEELEAYRAVHFPALTLLRKTMKIPSAASLRSEGRCPLTPEETVIMLAALGFKHRTSIYVAGANIYGGKSRMAAFRNLYPNLATKESLLSSSEIEPFQNFASQLAALDFIVCAAANAFAISDPGSQFSSLVSGYRMYYGGGRYPTIRPNKRRLASIFSKNSTIEWKEFEERVRKANKQSKVAQERPIARSIYRHPWCLECMCKKE